MSLPIEEIKTGKTYEIPVKGMGFQRLFVGNITNGEAICFLEDLEDSDFFLSKTIDIALNVIREVPKEEI